MTHNDMIDGSQEPSSETASESTEATTSKYYECGICDHLHPWGFNGDCRDDANRFCSDEVPDDAEILPMRDRVAADAACAAPDITSTASYQNAVRKLVDREVHYCVSMLIHELASNVESDYYDDILSVCVQDDWEEPATDHTSNLDRDECAEILDGIGIEVFDSESVETLREAIDANILDSTIDAQLFCEEYNLDPDTDEAYEHWIVSDWLAGKLEAKGEMVCRDIYGLTIWGRCCTGQAILLDGVMCAIYNDMGATWHLDDA